LCESTQEMLIQARAAVDLLEKSLVMSPFMEEDTEINETRQENLSASVDMLTAAQKDDSSTEAQLPPRNPYKRTNNPCLIAPSSQTPTPPTSQFNTAADRRQSLPGSIDRRIVLKRGNVREHRRARSRLPRAYIFLCYSPFRVITKPLSRLS